ncbi:hypothetical protein [Streptomyces sp. NRRL F-2580]|nr:hypothetical protein [Streptomyces sp. NRRL F-2580]
MTWSTFRIGGAWTYAGSVGALELPAGPGTAAREASLEVARRAVELTS